MLPTVFEHLISCGSCDSPILIDDPSSASRASKLRVTAAADPQDDRVGLVIRHEAREEQQQQALGGGPSSLDIFPFSEDHPLNKSPPPSPPHHDDDDDGGDGQQQQQQQQSICREVIRMEDCATPESRRGVSQDWGLSWASVEQHFAAVAAMVGRKSGECPCACHHPHRWEVEEETRMMKKVAFVLDAVDTDSDSGSNSGWPSEGEESDSSFSECASVNTTVPLVAGQENEKRPVRPGGGGGGRRALISERDEEGRSDGWRPEEARCGRRSRSEEALRSDSWILSWREQCCRVRPRRGSR
jgi:hypothetical protein